MRGQRGWPITVLKAVPVLLWPRYDEIEVASVSKKMKTIAAAAVVSALILALAVPAVAAPGKAKAPGGVGITAASGSSVSGQKIENLRNRITNVLRARKARFDAVTANLVKRQARVEALAGKVEALGGDVSRVREMIAESTQILEQARAQEQVCVQAFQAVPDAENRGAAFRSAKAEGREAVQLLKQSRTRLREATVELSRIAEGLATVEE